MFTRFGSNALTSVTLSEYKELNRTTWAFADYDAVGALLRPAAEQLVERLAVAPRAQLLDVATGSGNVAFAAAARGATVLGIDFTPEYLALARRRASMLGSDVALQLGDAEGLLVADGTFDFVTSTFGAQFAPRHRVVADELSRACRTGGIIGMCNWTPSSWTAEFQATLASHFPPPPRFVDDAMQWGTPSYVDELFGDNFIVSTSIERLRYEFSSPAAVIQFMEEHFGPAALARYRLRGAWSQVRDELIAITDRHFVSADDFTGILPEFLIVVATKTGERRAPLNA